MISVIGAGGWGTTLAALLASKGLSVKLWVREQELADIIATKHENTWFLRGIKIPDKLTITNDLKDTSNADILVTAVPSEFLRSVAKEMASAIKNNTIIVNVSKGLELHSCKCMSEVLEEEIPQVKIVALSGPNHAEEVSKKIPTATVIASKDKEILKKIKELFTTDYFKAYPHDDVIGVEICGAVKNITAIATGVCDGLGLGDNAKGSIITLGLTEMNNFGRYFGAKKATCYGLAGVGDLVATCTSKHSRNRFVGEKLAEGKSFEEINGEMHGMIAEGVKTTKAVYEFSQKHGINMPLTTQVYKVLYEKKELKYAIRDLINLI